MEDGGGRGWRAEALCSGMDLDLFFPGPGGRGAPEASRICGKCRHQLTCLAEHLDEPFGIWGGAPHPRRLLIRRLVDGGMPLRQADTLSKETHR